AVIFVERESQKAILIGRGGAGIKTLGRRSREKIEAFVGARVYLDLWVKPLGRWRKKRSALEHLGYPLPRDLEMEGSGGRAVGSEKRQNRRSGNHGRARGSRAD